MTRMTKIKVVEQCTDINKCKVTNWKEVKKTAEWERFAKKARVHIGLQCHRRMRRRRNIKLLYYVHYQIHALFSIPCQYYSVKQHSYKQHVHDVRMQFSGWCRQKNAFCDETQYIYANVQDNCIPSTATYHMYACNPFL